MCESQNLRASLKYIFNVKKGQTNRETIEMHNLLHCSLECRGDSINKPSNLVKKIATDCANRESVRYVRGKKKLKADFGNFLFCYV